MKKVLLVEGEIDFESIKQENLNDCFKIISFDYFAHKSLDEKQIPHKKIEEFFEKKDIEKLDNFSLKLATNWYKDKNIQKNIMFENLNLGTLIVDNLSVHFQ